jgi:hypothetical protein
LLTAAADAAVQIKELEKQLAEEQQHTSSTPAAPHSSASTPSSSEGSGNTCSKEKADESGGAQQLGKPGSGSFKQQMLSKQVAWWQHAVVTGLSVVCTMGYMGWEASWRCSTGGMLCAA